MANVNPLYGSGSPSPIMVVPDPPVTTQVPPTDPPLDPKPILIAQFQPFNPGSFGANNFGYNPSAGQPGAPGPARMYTPSTPDPTSAPRYVIPSDVSTPDTPVQPADTSRPAVTTPVPGGNGITPWNVMVNRDPDFLRAGETIRIDANRTHVVKPGETLSSIAQHYSVSVDSLIKINGMDASKLGKDPATGLYFAVGGASVGGVPTNPPGATAVTPTGNPNEPGAATPQSTPAVATTPTPTLPDTGPVRIALKWLMDHPDAVKYSAEDGKELLGLIDKLNSGKTLSPEEQKRYIELATQAQEAFNNRRQLPSPSATPPGTVLT
jgi:hypothetical protein